MEIKRELIDGTNYKVPCVTLIPPKFKGAAVLVHGYGGCKEETLGLAWRVAEKGFVTGAIDLRGHGEHLLELDENILSDLETAISHFKHFGKVTSIGHSLGGRLSLISSANFAIGISPALTRRFSPQTEGIINENRNYRVRSSPGKLFKILSSLPVYTTKQDNVMIIHGSRDIPEVSSACNDLKSEGAEVLQLEGALHSDIFLYEPTFEIVTEKLQEWYVNPKRN